MKKANRILSVLLLLALLIGTLPITVFAAESKSFTGTQGEYEVFQIFQDAEDFVNSALVTSGNVPGMSVSIYSDTNVLLEGTPTEAGSYTLEMTVNTHYLGDINFVLTITIEPPAPDPNGTPVVTKNPTKEEVVEGESATFIARADYAKQYEWVMISDDAAIGEVPCSGLKNIFPTLTVSGYDTEALTLTNIPVTMDGCEFYCRFVGTEESVKSKTAKLTVLSKDDVKPKITKEPTDEKVDEGGRAVFVAKADYVKSYTWKMVSPDDVTYNVADAASQFPGLKVTGADSEKLVLEKIPAELDGYRFYCVFTGSEQVEGKKAKLTVIPEETEATTEATTEPTEETTVDTAPSEDLPEDTVPQETQEQTVPPTVADKDADDSQEPGDSMLMIFVILVGIAVIAVAAIVVVLLAMLKGKGGGRYSR